MALRSGCNPGCDGGGGGGTCDEFMVGCWCPRAQPPLYCDAEGNPILPFSTDAGNVAQLGTDQRLFVPGPDTPPPDTGRKSIADLPAFFFGAHSAGALMTAYGSPHGVEHAIANGIDLVDNWSTTALDGVAIWTPYNQGTGLATYTTSPSTGSIGSITSAEASGLFVDAGNPYVATSQRSSAPTTDKPTGRDENWYGWSTGTWQLTPTASQLEMINARAVVNLRCNIGAVDVPSAVTAITQARAQTWAMITVFPVDIAQVSAITAAGITACVNVDTDTTITPATVTGSGATWVMIRYDQTDARIASFVAAGLQVMVVTTSSHFETSRAQVNGVRAVVALDPVYARGALGTPEALRYRTGSMDFISKGPRYGMLTYRTGQFSVVNGRGYTHTDVDGVGMDPQFQWQDSSTRRVLTGMGLGELNPMPNATSYTITWGALWRGTAPTDTFAKAGIWVAFDDDRDFATFNAGDPQPGINGYHAFVRPSNGSLVIGKVTNGTYAQLAVSATSQSWGANSWGSLELTVTATSLTLRRITGTPYSVTANDGDYRGPYVRASKEEGTATNGQFNLFTRNWLYTPGGA